MNTKMKKKVKSKVKKASGFRKTVFGNGLTLLSERAPGQRGLSIGVWIKVGTRHETSGEAGISHFLEHMLFKGTPRRSALQIAREIDQVGGDFNAFTAREDTCFHTLTLSRDAALGADILCDVLLNSSFASEELERERKVILQEVVMVEESPEELAHDIYLELVFGSHPLGRPIQGTENSVRHLSRGEILRFFRKHYRPDRIIVAVGGDISHDRLVKLFRPLAKRDWPGRPFAPAPTTAGEPRAPLKRESASLPPAARMLRSLKQPPPSVRDGFWWIERPTEQVHLIWGVGGPPISSEDRFAAFLLNIYLGGGMSSALFQEIREKRALAYTVYSSLMPFIDTGLFTVYVATSMAQVPLCLRLIEEAVAKLSREVLSRDELKTIQDNLKGSVLLASDDVESRMSSIARNELFLGKYASPEEVCELIDRVTPQDVRRVARQILGGEGRSILALGPKPSRKIVTTLRPERPRKYCRT